MDKHCKESAEGSSKKIGGYFQVPDMVFDLQLTANEKLVLIYFMRRADREGRSFPSVERICRDCGFKSKSTVRKVLKGLEKEGLVRIVRKPSKSNSFYVAGWLYEVIRKAKERHEKSEVAAPYESAKLRRYFKNETLKQAFPEPASKVQGDGFGGRVKNSSYTPYTPQNLYPNPSEFVPSTPPNLTPKEYTVEPDTEKEYTVNKEARKEKKRVLEEAGASSSLTSSDDDNKVTLLDVAEHLHSLTPAERREFDREALSLRKPGEPDPRDNLWQKRLLRVRYLQLIREGEG